MPVRPAIPDILEESLEELGFLAARLRVLGWDPDLPPRRLAEHHQRGAAWQAVLDLHPVESAALATAWLDAGRPPWLHAAAAQHWLASTKPDPVALAVRLQEQTPEQLPDWRQALRTATPHPAWAAESRSRERLPLVRHLLLDALGWHGQFDAHQIHAAAQDPEPLIRLAAARHGGLVPGTGDVLAGLCTDADPLVATHARYGLCLGDPARGIARAWAVVDALDARLLALFGDDAAVAPLAAAVGREPAAVAALAEHGSRAACAALLTQGTDGAAGLALLLGAEQPPHLDTWDALATGAARLVDGRPFPWSGPADEQPMRSRWRAAIRPGGVGPLRREIPDGLLAGEPGIAEPGV